MQSNEGLMEMTLIVYAAAVALIDWRTYRIPNALSLTAALAGLSLQFWLHGEAGLEAALSGAALGLGMFLPFYVVRAFGAGDVKAMATVGIFLGLQTTAIATALTLIAGAVLGVIVLLTAPEAGATRYRLIGLLVAPLASLQRRGSVSSPQPRVRFPYGVAIATGTVAAMLFTGRTHFWM